MTPGAQETDELLAIYEGLESCCISLLFAAPEAYGLHMGRIREALNELKAFKEGAASGAREEDGGRARDAGLPNVGGEKSPSSVVGGAKMRNSGIEEGHTKEAASPQGVSDGPSAPIAPLSAEQRDRLNLPLFNVSLAALAGDKGDVSEAREQVFAEVARLVAAAVAQDRKERGS